MNDDVEQGERDRRADQASVLEALKNPHLRRASGRVWLDLGPLPRRGAFSRFMDAVERMLPDELLLWALRGFITGQGILLAIWIGAKLLVP